MAKRDSNTQETLVNVSRSKKRKLKDKAADLFLHDYYQVITSEHGIQLLIDEYVMGLVESLLYSGKRYSLYLLYGRYCSEKIPLYPDLTQAVLLTDQAFVKPVDPYAFYDPAEPIEKQYEEFVSIDTGPMDKPYKHMAPNSNMKTAQFWMVDPSRKNRCISMRVVPCYSRTNQPPDDEFNRSPNHGLLDYRHMMFTRYTQEQHWDSLTLKRFSINLHMQRILGHFDVSR